MTDAVPPMQDPAPRRHRNWLRIALVASLAVNLAVGGMVAGAVLRRGVPLRAECDAGLGPIADAMTRGDRRQLRDALVARYRELGADGAALSGDYDLLLESLRAEPFAPAAVDAALVSLAARNADRLEAARAILSGYVGGLTPEARILLADRLDKVLSRKDRHRKKHGSARGLTGH